MSKTNAPAAAGDARAKRFPQLTLETVAPESQQVAREILEISSIGLGGPYNVMLRSPIFADRIKHLLDYLRFETSLSKRLNEFAKQHPDRMVSMEQVRKISGRKRASAEL